MEIVLSPGIFRRIDWNLIIEAPSKRFPRDYSCMMVQSRKPTLQLVRHSNLLSSSIDEAAKNQLMRRFCLVDAIARLAFKQQVIYTGKVFVPRVPEGTQEEELPLAWKRIDDPEDLDTQETQVSDSSKLSDIISDQRYCTITVSVAPSCISER